MSEANRGNKKNSGTRKSRRNHNYRGGYRGRGRGRGSTSNYNYVPSNAVCDIYICVLSTYVFICGFISIHDNRLYHN